MVHSIHRTMDGALALPDTALSSSIMTRSKSLLAAVLMTVAAISTGTAQSAPALEVALEEIRAKHQLPALAAAAVSGGELVAQSAVGVRKLGSGTAVTLTDKWHIGSCGKSMTASLAAILVQEGKIRWTSTVGEIFPEWRGRIHEKWEGVTLEQLLAHRGGLAEEPPTVAWALAWLQRGTPREQRERFLTAILTEAPAAEAGREYIYSNQGYALAGAMLEKVTGTAWEELMLAKLFRPLGMASAGFGAPGETGKLDQPWGHEDRRGKLQGVSPGGKADNPPAIAPAGTMHFSISDFARYAAWHAAEGKAKPQLLTPESFAKLHTALGSENYALGWRVLKRTWAGGRALTHAGSNTMWFAVMWIAPEKNLALVAATNAATPGAEAGL
jgi:CubicO group peptidase (beta-lactamase class C family)